VDEEHPPSIRPPADPVDRPFLRVQSRSIPS
jgi:hypothetical protein